MRFLSPNIVTNYLKITLLYNIFSKQSLCQRVFSYIRNNLVINRKRHLAIKAFFSENAYFVSKTDRHNPY